MRRGLMLIVLMGMMAACTSEDTKIPDDIMPVDKMKPIVWDLVYAGAYATIMKEKDTSLKQINTAYFAEVLKLHNTKKEVFFKSFDFYQKHPSLNKVLFDSVSAYGQRQRNVLYQQQFIKKK